MKNNNLKTIEIKDVPYLKINGRTTGDKSPLTLFWTGSGIECNVRASEFWIEVESGYDMYEPWISALVNRAQVSHQMLPEGRYWVCIFRNMDPNKVKNVCITKDVQAMAEDPGHCLQIHGIRTDGEFLPVEDKKLKLEIIGDSITSGEGTIGAKEEEDWISMFFSSQNDYATMVANEMNGELRIISQSGWGVLSGWDNNPNSYMAKGYEQVCGILTGDKNQALGVHNPNDFNAYQPDVIIINLGTNDGGAFNSPAYLDEETGIVYKQRMEEDGTLKEEDLEKFQAAVVSFLEKIRTYNPNSHLLWVYGMLGNVMQPGIEKAMNQYKEKNQDGKVSFLALPEMTEEGTGSRCHPGLICHQISAKIIVEELRKILK